MTKVNDWRSRLTEDELEELAGLEEAIRLCKLDAKLLQVDRRRIVYRAHKRSHAPQIVVDGPLEKV